MADNKKFIGIARISAQRARHERLGFNAKHDDTHTRGELARAGLAYIEGRSVYWPFESAAFRPSLPNAFTYGFDRPLYPGAPVNPWTPERIDARISDLERGGSFIAAEIDRLARLKEVLIAKARKDDDEPEADEGGAGVPTAPVPPTPPSWMRESIRIADEGEKIMLGVDVAHDERELATASARLRAHNCLHIEPPIIPIESIALHNGRRPLVAPGVPVSFEDAKAHLLDKYSPALRQLAESEASEREGEIDGTR